jgi:hypothetical protein
VVPYCDECGKRLTADAKFCPDCGTRISAKAVRSPKKPEARPTTPHKWRTIVIVGVIAFVVVATAVVTVSYFEQSGGGGGGGGGGVPQPIFTTISAIMQNPNAYLNQEVLVNGTVLAGGSSGMASDGGKYIDLTFPSSSFPQGFLALNQSCRIVGRVFYNNAYGLDEWEIIVSNISTI